MSEAEITQTHDPKDIPSISGDPVALAATDLIGRTGASSLRICYQDDDQPVIWCALAEYAREGEPTGYQVGASLDPTTALLKLLAELVDGGACVHCKRPTAFSADDINPTTWLPGNDVLCWYRFDPRSEKFVGSCELLRPVPTKEKQ